MSPSPGLIGSGMIGEVLLRARPWYGNAPMLHHPVLHHIHPNNYTFRYHHPGGEHDENIVAYDTQGLVSDPYRPVVSSLTDSAHYRNTLMGDSFVEAVTVSSVQSFGGRLAAAAGEASAVRNYGDSSCSPALYLIQWRELVRHSESTHVFLLLYENDVNDDRDHAGKGTYSPSCELIAVPGDAGGASCRSAAAVLPGQTRTSCSAAASVEPEERPSPSRRLYPAPAGRSGPR